MKIQVPGFEIGITPYGYTLTCQSNFAELEQKLLSQQFGKVATAATALPNHEEELSEKDDDAGRNNCPGACLCNHHHCDSSNTDE